MDIPPPITIATLVFFIVIGLAPSLPTIGRYLFALLALGLGAYIYYVGFDQAMFNLPNGDNLAISALFGGAGGQAGFNKLSLGFISGVLGILFLVLGAVGRAVLLKVMSKKESSN